MSLPLGDEITNETIDELLYKRRGVDPKEAEVLYRQPDYEALQRAMSKKEKPLRGNGENTTQ